MLKPGTLHHGHDILAGKELSISNVGLQFLEVDPAGGKQLKHLLLLLVVIILSQHSMDMVGDCSFDLQVCEYRVWLILFKLSREQDLVEDSLHVRRPGVGLELHVVLGSPRDYLPAQLLHQHVVFINHLLRIIRNTCVGMTLKGCHGHFLKDVNSFVVEVAILPADGRVRTQLQRIIA